MCCALVRLGARSVADGTEIRRWFPHDVEQLQRLRLGGPMCLPTLQLDGLSFA